MSTPLTTHVLDTATGRPAEGVPVVLEIQDGDGWRKMADGVTNADGRVSGLLPPGRLPKAVLRMSFDTTAYWARSGTKGFYPVVRVVFQVTEPEGHHHIPLLLSPFGYSTYRGS